MIYSILNPPEKTRTKAGDEFINTYQESINKAGKKELKKIGKHNVYEEIQLDVENCKIENILHQVAMGDLNALNQRDATYVDATTMPKNLREAQDIVLRMKDEFYNMPLEVRKEFENSPEMYVSLMGTNEFLEKMAPYNAKMEAIAKEKNMKEYQNKVKEGAKLNIDIEREMKNMEGGLTNE